MFENSTIVDRFLNFWRRSGHQRIGFLYGRYETFEGVPLGIKAVVSSIYEPPQVKNKKNFFWHLINIMGVNCSHPFILEYFSEPL